MATDDDDDTAFRPNNSGAFSPGPRVYAFNPPSDSSGASHTGKIGLGAYYANLGMRREDVDRRLRGQDMTGKDYLDVHASYNVHKDRDKARK